MKQKHKFLFTLVLILLCSQSFAQENVPQSPWWKQNNLAEFGASVGYYEFSLNVNAHHLHPIKIGKKSNLKIGYGLRFTSYFGDAKDYVTAPAKLTSGEEGPQVMYLDNIVENIDTVFIKYPQVYSTNLFFVIQYTFFNKLDLGFNIDLIGFSFSNASADGGYKLSSLVDNPFDPIKGDYKYSYDANQRALPTAFNLLLISDNDLGSLNSEFFLRYRFGKHWGIKGGYTFLFTEYQTENKLRLDNDRFRLKSSMALLGVTYSF
ncbi:MAG: hypothetical protein ACKVOU_02030 [Cytophagales bacterium]